MLFDVGRRHGDDSKRVGAPRRDYYCIINWFDERPFSKDTRPKSLNLLVAYVYIYIHKDCSAKDCTAVATTWKIATRFGAARFVRRSPLVFEFGGFILVLDLVVIVCGFSQ